MPTMLALDVRTQFISVITVHLALGLIMIVGLRRRRKRELSLTLWGYAIFSGGAGLFLLMFRGAWPDILTKTVANILVSAEFVLMYLSLCAYFGVREMWFWKYGPLVLSAIVFSVVDAQAARNIASGIIHGSQLVPLLMVVAAQGFSRQMKLRITLIAVISLMTLQFWMRAIRNIMEPEWVVASQQTGSTDPLTLLVGMGVVVVLTATIWLLHWDQSEADLREQRDMAMRLSAEKSRFLAAASHDLRSPIQAITLYLQALGLERLSVEQRALHTKLTVVTNELGTLLNSLLHLAQIDNGGTVPKKMPFAVSDLLTRLDEEFAVTATQKRLRWKLQWPAKMPAVESDFSLLLTLVRNLVSNAIKYTPEGGVLVTARMRRGRLLLQVWDTGIGIAEEHRKLLFNEFYQANNPSRTRSQGVGLGLSIVKRLAVLLGCELSYRSVVGRGSVFNVLLPACTTTLECRAVVDASVAQIKPHDVTRVVLVEDNDMIADALSQWASNEGLRVLRFATGEDAMQQSDVSATDCFLVDHRLAGKMTGFEFLVNRTRVSGPVRGVIVTGETVQSLPELSKCPWLVLSKPVSTADLQAALHLAPTAATTALDATTMKPLMKREGKCYREYPEFPLAPFNPSVFGFSNDRSNRRHAKRCPCFATGSGHVLWMNWPEAAEREWGAPMTRFVITRGEPDDADAEIVFDTEHYSELVRHLLVTPYVSPRPILEREWPAELAEDFFNTLAMGGFLCAAGDSPILVDTLKLSALGDEAGAAATAYVRAIEAKRGAKALPLATNALSLASGFA